MGALRYVDRPDYRAILFRRTYGELEKSLIERARQYLPKLGASYNEQKKTWAFPSGAKLIFSHMQHVSDVEEHLSAEYQFVGFDEGTTFEEKQFTFLMSRLRSSTGIPCRIRWASNPADDDNHWLIKRYAPWIDTRPTYAGYRAKAGETLYFSVEDDGSERIVPKGTPGALARCYFPAKLTDNPTLMKNDPGYADRIRRMGPAAAKRYLDGDWFARDVKGALFDQADFDRYRIPDPRSVPPLRYVAIGVDPAVSNTDTSDEHGIIGGGVADDGHVYISLDASTKGDPARWGRAVADAFQEVRADTTVAEVNQGGDLVEANIANTDRRIPVKKVRATRGKHIRAEPVATLLRRGYLHIVGALPELESECRRWIPGVSNWSPNRMDALVWLVSELVPGIIPAESETPAPPPTLQQQEDAFERALIERHENPQEQMEWTG